MSNREEFEKFMTERREMPENEKSSLAYAIWQAACKLKDKVIVELRSELGALKSQKPVAWPEITRMCYWFVSDRHNLYARPVPAIREGFALVRIDPTDEAITEVCERHNMYRVDALNVWDSFIAAAQKGTK